MYLIEHFYNSPHVYYAPSFGNYSRLNTLALTSGSSSAGVSFSLSTIIVPKYVLNGTGRIVLILFARDKRL